ncbi:MAG TPA: hypothetical protein VJZ00_16785 [Thermoanaerobaculia bacterium]|nr:hypothetical protein [Thermoanaerobaculia bacterium]
MTVTFHRPPAADQSEDHTDAAEAEHSSRPARGLLADTEREDLFE